MAAAGWETFLDAVNRARVTEAPEPDTKSLLVEIRDLLRQLTRPVVFPVPAPLSPLAPYPGTVRPPYVPSIIVTCRAGAVSGQTF